MEYLQAIINDYHLMIYLLQRNSKIHCYRDAD